MPESISSEAGCTQYELEIPIKAPRSTVWHAILEETNAWWLPDFHMIDADSTVEFDVRPGGRGLVEHRENGAFLVWYMVQFYLPDQYKIYLVGHVAPEWGGPSTSNLSLSLEDHADGCVLKICDAHHGRVNESYMRSLKEGWGQLFGEGLQKHVQSA